MFLDYFVSFVLCMHATAWKDCMCMYVCMYVCFLNSLSILCCVWPGRTVCVFVCLYVYECMYMLMYVYYTYIHTYIHKHIHTCICAHVLAGPASS